jgi:hypothetical protein
MASKTIQNRITKHLSKYAAFGSVTDLAYAVAQEHGSVTKARAYTYTCAILEMLDAGTLTRGNNDEPQLATENAS